MSQEIMLETFYPHPPERVWQALTDCRALSVWMMDNDFEACLGHRFRFQSSPLPGLNVTIYGEVLEVEAPKRLVYSWKEHPSDPASRVIWTLSPVEGGTQVRLQHRATGFVSIPGFGRPTPVGVASPAENRVHREIDSQCTDPTAFGHLLQTAAATSTDGLHRFSEFLNYQTNWHYWLKQKLPEILAESSL